MYCHQSMENMGPVVNKELNNYNKSENRNAQKNHSTAHHFISLFWFDKPSDSTTKLIQLFRLYYPSKNFSSVFFSNFNTSESKL